MMSIQNLKLFFVLSVLLLVKSSNHPNVCGNAEFEKKINMTELDLGSTEARMLQNVEYQPIRIYVDYTNLDNQMISLTQEQIYGVKQVISQSVDVYQNLIKVKRVSLPLKINSCSNLIISSQVSITGVQADLVLFPYVDFGLAGSSTIAYAGACRLSSVNSRPLAGIIAFNKDVLFFSNTNAVYYLSMIGLHELNHVLAFSSSLFDKYIDATGNKIPINQVRQTFFKRGKNVNMIILPKVKEAARKHFNCPTLEGVELEDQGDAGTVGSHWDARIMYGDNMIGTSETENVLSEITLALLEDTGWYKLNYYTGGLFRYGKNQGCSFLNEKCIVNGIAKFKNEFPISTGNAYTCYGSRTSRGRSIISTFDNNLESYFQYFINPKSGGYRLADYCPVPYSIYKEEFFYSGSCVVGSSVLPQALGESISDKSYCFYSSLVPNGDDTLDNYRGYYKPICHEVICDYSTKTYTVKIGNASMNCGNTREIKTLNGFTGIFECVDFVQICTKVVECGNTIDCVNNKSLPISLPDCQSNTYVNRLDLSCVAATDCPENTFAEDSSKTCIDAKSCPSTLPYGNPLTKLCVIASDCSINYYADDSKKLCVIASNCDYSAPFGDSISKKCVQLTSCDPNYPWGDENNHLCSTLNQCFSNNLFGDPKTNKCVEASKCSSENPYGDPFTKLCTNICSTDNPIRDPQTNLCVTDTKCSSNYPYVDPYGKICISTCSSDYCIRGNYCRKCDECPNNLFRSGDKCVPTCPDQTQVDNENKICYDCGSTNSYFHINKCENECPEYYAPNPNGGVTCIKCPSLSMKWYQKKCVNVLPSGTVEISSEFAAYKSCKESGTFFYNNECVEKCPNTFYPDKENNCLNNWYQSGKYLFIDKVVEKCPESYLSNDKNICYLCSSINLFYYDLKCVDKCPENYVVDENKSCKSCQSYNKYFFNGSCVENCPINSTLKDFICECTNAFKYYPAGKNCVENCPPTTGYLSKNNSCVACEKFNMYYYKEYCLNSCPEGTLGDVSSYSCEVIPNLNPISNENLTTCNPNPCKNLGICLIKDSTVTCRCPDKFYGTSCEYTEANIIEATKKFESFFTKLIENSEVNIYILQNSVRAFKTIVTAIPQNDNSQIVTSLTGFLTQAIESDPASVVSSSEQLDSFLDTLSTLFVLSIPNSQNYTSRLLFNMKLYGESLGFSNISKIKNSLKIIIETIFQKRPADLNSYLKYDSFSIRLTTITNFQNTSKDFINNNQPYIDFTTCIQSLKNTDNENNTFLVAQLIFDPNLMSNITKGDINSFAVYGSIYDSTINSIMDIGKCENLSVYLPDPGYHRLSEEIISVLLSMNVNFYQRGDHFYNDRCIQFFDENKGIDITLNERRKYYISPFGINCLNYDYKTLDDLNYCSLSGIMTDGYLRCTCKSNFSELTLYRIDHSTSFKSINGINLDIMGCPLILKYNNQLWSNSGIVLTIIFLALFITFAFLIIFLYNDAYLINKYLSTIRHNDFIINSNTNFKNMDKISGDIETYKADIINVGNNRAPKVIEKNNFVGERDVITTVNMNVIANHSNNPSIRDFYNFSNEEKLTKDKRSFIRYFWDQLANTHILLLFFYKKSLLTSPLIRMFLLTFYIAMLFLLNAMFYTDNYIDDRSKNYSENYWNYVWNVELVKSLEVCILTIFPVTLMHILVSPFNSINLLIIGYLKGEKASLEEENKNYEKKMLPRYIFFIIIYCLLIGFSFFYLIIFSGVYHFSQLGWLYGGIASFIIDVFGIMLILPLVGAFFRLIALNLKFMNWLIIWTKVDEWNFYIHN